jgi:hypothetical protein
VRIANDRPDAAVRTPVFLRSVGLYANGIVCPFTANRRDLESDLAHCGAQPINFVTEFRRSVQSLGQFCLNVVFRSVHGFCSGDALTGCLSSLNQTPFSMNP